MVALLFALWGSSLAFSATPAASVDHLFDNASDGSPAISLIQSAKKSLDLEIYTLKDLNVIVALKSAMVRGVKLRIIQTPNPVLDPCPVFAQSTLSTVPACIALRAFVAYVRLHGGTYIPFSFNLCGVAGSSCYQHGKMMIVDHKKVLLSTGNFDPSNLCDLPEFPSRCNRDYTVTTTDPSVVQTLKKIFENDLIGNAYSVAALPAKDSRVTVSPDSMTPILNFIASAQKTLQIENQYLNDPTLNEAIIAAAKRGVQVFVMVSSVTAFGKLDPEKDRTKILRWISNFTAYDRAGIHSKIFDDQMKINGQPGYLHAKAILVDGAHAWIGSVNGSTKSLTQNREFGIFSDDKAFVKHLSEVMYADFTHRNAETWKQSLVCKNDACGVHHSVPDDSDIDVDVLNDEGSGDISPKPYEVF